MSAETAGNTNNGCLSFGAWDIISYDSHGSGNKIMIRND